MLHVQEQRGSPLPQYPFTYLSIRHYKKTLYLICYNIVSALYFDFFGHKACENLASRPGIESITSALAGKVLTTGKLIVKLKKKKKISVYYQTMDFSAVQGHHFIYISILKTRSGV